MRGSINWWVLAGPSACALAASGAITLLPPARWIGWVIGPAAMLGIVVFAIIAGHKLKLRQADTHAQALFGVGVTIAYAVLLMTSCFWPGGWGGTSMPFSFMIMGGGVQIMIFALRTRRVGESRHCPSCDYELGCDPAIAPTVCPECATAWRDRWVTGARTRSVPLAATGAVLCFIGASPFLMKLGGLAAGAMTLTPNALLITTAATDPWGNNKATWAEVGRRTLSQDETDRLATKLLNLRRAEGYLHGPPAAWMEAAAASATLSPPLLQRYYDEWFEAEIDLPSTVNLGQVHEVSVRGEERGRGPGTSLYIWVHEVRVDGIPLETPEPNKSVGRWIYSLYLKRGEKYAPHPDVVVLPHSWTPATAGDHQIELVFYRCIVPSNMMPPGAVGPDGRPARPGASTHFEERTLRKTVRVIAPR